MEKQVVNPEHQQSASLRVSEIASLQGLLPLREQIDSLSSIPFLKSAWMFPWIETWCDRKCRLCFLIVEDDRNRVVGFAPLVRQKSLKRGRYLAFVGSGKACADYMKFPTLPGFQEKVLHSVTDWLTQDNGQWDRIEFEGVMSSEDSSIAFGDLMAKQECDVYRSKSLSSWRLELPESWDDFMSTLSKNSRKKFRRQARALDGKSELRQATDAHSLREGMQVLEELHTARWNTLGESGCFAHPGFREFLTKTAKQCLANDTLSLVWLTFEGQPIAADIGFRSESGLFTYQGGISNDHLDLEPGRAIIRSQMELAMERGLKFIDFLRGDEPYKARFNTCEIENVRYELVANKVRSRAIHSMLEMGRLIKSQLG